MAEFRITRKAAQDLRDIWGYTYGKWSKAQADKYYRTLMSACSMIADNSAAGRNYEMIPDKYLGYAVGRHIIFYKAVAQDEVEIIRILHVKMDLMQRIRE